MSRKNKSSEVIERRAKIRELLQAANIGGMEDIQSLFKETIAELWEMGLKPSLKKIRATASMITATRIPKTAATGQR